jgi:hypothetical protein
MAIYGDGVMKAPKVRMVFYPSGTINSTIEVEIREIVRTRT